MAQRTRSQQVTQEVTYEVACDACGKTVAVEPQRGTVEPAGWAHFSSGHSEWGNDSIDTYDEHDACSFPCYVTVVRRLVEERWCDERSLRIDGRDRTFMEGMLAALASATTPEGGSHG